MAENKEGACAIGDCRCNQEYSLRKSNESEILKHGRALYKSCKTGRVEESDGDQCDVTMLAILERRNKGTKK